MEPTVNSVYSISNLIHIILYYNIYHVYYIIYNIIYIIMYSIHTDRQVSNAIVEPTVNSVNYMPIVVLISKLCTRQNIDI